MNSIFQVSRVMWSRNDMDDYNSGGYKEVDVVGIYTDHQHAMNAKIIVDAWPRDESGKDEEHGIGWSRSTEDCVITILEINTMYLQPFAPEGVKHAVELAAIEEEREILYKAKKLSKENAQSLFDGLGAEKHCKGLGYYLAMAGCYTLEDLKALGAHEFSSNVAINCYRSEYTWQVPSDVDLREGLRDFKATM